MISHVISTSLEKLSILDLHNIFMVVLFSFSSILLPWKGIIFFFSIAHFLNKIAKPNCKAPFSKLLKDAILKGTIKSQEVFKHIHLQRSKRLLRLWWSSYAI